jgi:hypothetical protein
MALAPRTVQSIPDLLRREAITVLHPICFQTRNAECIVTRSLPVGSPPVSHFEDFLLGINGAARA